MGQMAVVVFPRADLSAVEAFRARFDPHASLIPAHITLVFPFAPPAALALNEHLAVAARECSPIRAHLEPAPDSEGDYLMMWASDGAQEITRLHLRLYSGPLAPYLSQSHVFRPHLTLGRISDPGARAAALRHARADIAPIDVLLADLAVFDVERGSVDYTVPLSGSSPSLGRRLTRRKSRRSLRTQLARSARLVHCSWSGTP